MNPLLAKLHPYPFERLSALTRDITPNPAFKPISLGIGEPKHATPQLILDALVANEGASQSVFDKPVRDVMVTRLKTLDEHSLDFERPLERNRLVALVQRIVEAYKHHAEETGDSPEGDAPGHDRTLQPGRRWTREMPHSPYCSIRR